MRSFEGGGEGIRLDVVDEELEVAELPATLDLAIGLVSASIESAEYGGELGRPTHPKFSSSSRRMVCFEQHRTEPSLGSHAERRPNFGARPDLTRAEHRQAV